MSGGPFKIHIVLYLLFTFEIRRKRGGYKIKIRNFVSARPDERRYAHNQHVIHTRKEFFIGGGQPVVACFGQTIRSGELIGYNAEAENGEVKLFEFELWNNGKPVDPEEYIVF